MPVEYLIVLDHAGTAATQPRRDRWEAKGSIIVGGDVAADVPRLWVYERERVARSANEEQDEWPDLTHDARAELLEAGPWAFTTRAELLDRIFAAFQPCTVAYQSEGGGETYEKRGR